MQGPLECTEIGHLPSALPLTTRSPTSLNGSLSIIHHSGQTAARSAKMLWVVQSTRVLHLLGLLPFCAVSAFYPAVRLSH